MVESSTAPKRRELAADGLQPVFSLVPGAAPVELVSYYPEFEHYYPECELQTKRWFVEMVRPDWTIIDAGANVGYYTILFSRLASKGRVIAVEPTKTMAMLQANVSNSGCTNVDFRQVALGRRSGHRTDSIFRIWGRAPEKRKYNFMTLDDLVDELKLARLDCIKIDTDSFDFEILQGAEDSLKQFDPWVVVELNHALSQRNQSVPEALTWLAAQGYKTALVLDNDNYVLKRSADGEYSGQPVAAITLAFEQRPLFLESGIEKHHEYPEFFAADFLRQEQTTLAPENGGTRVTFLGPQWAYAALLPRSKLSRKLTGPVIVEAELTVNEGTIGVACLKSISEMACRESFKFAAPGHQIAELVADAEDVAMVVFRNAGEENEPLRFTVHSVRAFAAHPAAPGPPPALLVPDKRRLSLAECRNALARQEPDTADASDSAGFDIVPIEELGSALSFDTPFVAETKVYHYPLARFNTAIDESATYRYIYRNLQPARHLEFGTWEGWGVTLCASSCDAEIWTINLPEGEVDVKGNPVYATRRVSDLGPNGDGTAEIPSDSGAMIGWRYRQAGYGHRVHQILCDSRDFDAESFGAGFFDSVLIDGGHAPDVVSSDTNKALSLVRAGGILIWHDFCPDVQTLAENEAPRGVLQAWIDNYSAWRPQLAKLFWIRPSWMLIGVKA